MTYPKALTTDVWTDLIRSLDRQAAIAALATFHRRVEYDGAVRALNGLIEDYRDHASDEDTNPVSLAAERALKRLAAPVDYIAD